MFFSFFYNLKTAFSGLSVVRMSAIDVSAALLVIKLPSKLWDAGSCLLLTPVSDLYPFLHSVFLFFKPYETVMVIKGYTNKLGFN